MAELVDGLRRLEEKRIHPDVLLCGLMPEEAREMIQQLPAIIAALERAEEVADQSCEFCEHAVDDLGQERDGGREPHAYWWACGRCWNESAQETGTIIGHLSHLLDCALERIPELEQEIEEDAGVMRALRRQREEAERRAERLKAAAREFRPRNLCGSKAKMLPYGRVQYIPCGECVECRFHAALAAAPAEATRSCPECGHPMMQGPLQSKGRTVAWWCANCHHSIAASAEEGDDV